jgi:hypothetical protein
MHLLVLVGHDDLDKMQLYKDARNLS